jgi:hypothetical protein
MLPLSSTAAQNALVGQDTPVRSLVESIAVTLTQVALAPAVGLVLYSALPLSSTARQKLVDGQDTLVRVLLSGGAGLGALQVLATPAFALVVALIAPL